MRTSLLLAVLAVIPLAPSAASAGACARPQILTRALTKPGAELAKGGGVVVAMESAEKAPTLTFSIGGKSVAATTTSLGAGLVVYSPPAGTGAAALQDKGTDLVAVKLGDAKAVAAPKLGKVLYYSSTGRRGTYVSISVEVAGGIPAGVVAVGIFDDKGKLRSWGDTTNVGEMDPATKKLRVSVYASGSCVVQPDGFAPSATGDKIQVAFIDGSGRISAKTAATIVAAPQPKGSISP